eukprot:scaffold22731_cov64-Phaeocystis_antarctica.AAC.1
MPASIQCCWSSYRAWNSRSASASIAAWAACFLPLSFFGGTVVDGTTAAAAAAAAARSRPTSSRAAAKRLSQREPSSRWSATKASSHAVHRHSFDGSIVSERQFVQSSSSCAGDEGRVVVSRASGCRRS